MKAKLEKIFYFDKFVLFAEKRQENTIILCYDIAKEMIECLRLPFLQIVAVN